MIFQEHRERRSKTGTSDKSMVVDFAEVNGWIHRPLEIVSRGAADDYVFNLSYPDVVAEFDRSVLNLGIQGTGREKKVLYMGRHSGPSIDVAVRRTPLLGCRRREGGPPSKACSATRRPGGSARA